MLSQIRHPDLYGETVHPFTYESILTTLGNAFENGTTYNVIQFENEMFRLQRMLFNPQEEEDDEWY